MTGPIIEIKTLSGERVSAPLVQWVQALILRLPNDDLVELMQMVERAQSPLVIATPSGTVPADPNEWMQPNGRLRPQEPRRS